MRKSNVSGNGLREQVATRKKKKNKKMLDTEKVHFLCEDCEDPIETTFGVVKNCTMITHFLQGMMLARAYAYVFYFEICDDFLSADCGATTRDTPMPLPSIKKTVFVKVLEWLTKNLEQPVRFDEQTSVTLAEFKEWEGNMFASMDHSFRFDFLAVANALDCKTLQLETCRYFASLVNGKQEPEIRKEFSLPPNPFPPLLGIARRFLPGKSTHN